MRAVVLGARGGVGRHVVARAAGWNVVAVARDGAAIADKAPTESAPNESAPNEGAGSLQGRDADVRDARGMVEVLEGADAMLWCVGVAARSGPDVGRMALPVVVEAARRHGLERLVSVSGAAVTVPGDHKSVGAPGISRLTRLLAPGLVADKQAGHDVLAASDLAWTVVRPPRLSETAGTGRWRLDEMDPGLSATPVAKVDVARAMVDLASNGQWLRRSPFLHAGKG